MKKQNTKYYISNKNHHFELILCNNSTKSYPIHNHVSVYTIGYMLNGMIELKTSTNINQYKKDDFFILTPYAPHALTVLEPYSMLIACIHKKEIEQMRYDFIQTEMKELVLQVDILDSMQQDIFLSIIKDVICNISFSIEKPQACDSHIISHLELHPEEKLSIDEMAQEAYTSKYQFIRNFKRDVGITPHQFQIQNQVRKAQKDLIKTENITEVAQNSGFFDQSHFIRHFEKIVQLTPTEYKSSCQIMTDTDTKAKQE